MQVTGREDKFYIFVRREKIMFGNTILYSSHNKPPIDVATLLEILKAELSPPLSEAGLKWNEKYLWYSDSINSIRKVFQYSLLKGASATFAWGVCIDFIPIVKRNQVKYYRTQKSITQHIFEWPEDYSLTFKGINNKDRGMTSHWGDEKAKESIKKLFNANKDIIFDWFKSASTVEQLIKIAEHQLKPECYYISHYPPQKYILAFLYAKIGNVNKGMSLLEEIKDSMFREDQIGFEKAKDRLLKIS